MRSTSLKASHGEYKIMVLACQVGPFHLKLTQINSETYCIVKHKCTVSQKLDTRRRGEKLSATTATKATTYIFAFFVFALVLGRGSSLKYSARFVCLFVCFFNPCRKWPLLRRLLVRARYIPIACSCCEVSFQWN